MVWYGEWWAVLAKTAVQNAYCAVGGPSCELGLPVGKHVVAKQVYERATRQAEESFGFALQPGEKVQIEMRRQVYCSFRSPIVSDPIVSDSHPRALCRIK
jgi:hypothetical protein